MCYEPGAALQSAQKIIKDDPSFSTDKFVVSKLGIEIDPDIENPNFVYKAWASEIIRYAGDLQDDADKVLQLVLVSKTSVLKKPEFLIDANRKASVLLKSAVDIQCEARKCVAVLVASGLNGGPELSQAVVLSVGRFDGAVRTVIDNVSNKLAERSNRRLAWTNLAIAVVALAIAIATPWLQSLYDDSYDAAKVAVEITGSELMDGTELHQDAQPAEQ